MGSSGVGDLYMCTCLAALELLGVELRPLLPRLDRVGDKGGLWFWGFGAG